MLLHGHCILPHIVHYMDDMEMSLRHIWAMYCNVS